MLGAILGGRTGASRDVALALNGRIVATGGTFHLRESAADYYSVIVHEESLRSGRNRVEVFEVQSGLLVPLATTGQ